MLRLELCALDAHLAAHPPTFAGFRRDCLVELLYQLALVPAKNQKLARYLAAEPRAYIPLSAKLLRRRLGRDYRKYLDWALDSCLLETDNHYIPLYKCLAWRYAAPFRRDGARAGFRTVRLTDPALLARLRQLQTTPTQSPWSRQARKDYAPILDSLHPRTCRLRIHTEAALAFIAAERERVARDPSLREAKPKRRRKKKKLVAPKDPFAFLYPSCNAGKKKPHRKKVPRATTKDLEEQYQQRFHSIAQLDTHDFRYTIDPYGRLHTVLTRLSARLRPYVHAEGCSHLIALDLKNSQPYIANLLLNSNFYDTPWKKGRRGAHPPITLWQEGRSLAEEREQEEQVSEQLQPTSSRRPALAAGRRPQPNYPDQPNSQTSQPGKTGQTSQSPTAFYVMRCRHLLGISDEEIAEFPADVALFRHLTSSGEFYEQMQALLGPALSGTTVDRDKVKEIMFEVFFSKNGMPSEAKAAFAQLFPTVDAVLRTFKAMDYSYLAKLLQTLESHLFLRSLVPLVRRQWPELPVVFSVHDSLIVPEEYADRVEALMRTHLTRWVGVPPQFKRERWGGAVPPETTPAALTEPGGPVL